MSALKQNVLAALDRLDSSDKEKRILLDRVQMRHVAQHRLVVGCTTSGAAKYRCAPPRLLL